VIVIVGIISESGDEAKYTTHMHLLVDGKPMDRNFRGQIENA
jgi:hypothetical protein